MQGSLKSLTSQWNAHLMRQLPRSHYLLEQLSLLLALGFLAYFTSTP
jgi:hypothetical protein